MICTKNKTIIIENRLMDIETQLKNEPTFSVLFKIGCDIISISEDSQEILQKDSVLLTRVNSVKQQILIITSKPEFKNWFNTQY